MLYLHQKRRKHRARVPTASGTRSISYDYARLRFEKKVVSNGTWWVNANEWVYAYETGHLASLPDNYADEKGIDPKTGKEITVCKPAPGHDGHMMATFRGEVAQHEVHDIVNNVSCSCDNK